MEESAIIERIFEKARKLLYRPTYTQREFNIFVYASETRRLNDKQALIQELQIQLEEDRKDLIERHQKHMNKLIEMKARNPLE